MKGLWILGGLAAAAVALAFLLSGESSSDLDRKYQEAVKERPVIEKALAESKELVDWFADRRPTERKKGELGDLRRRFEALEKAARSALEDESSQPRSKDERRKALTKLAEDYWVLKRDAEDLVARLREMRSFDDQLRPWIVKVGELTRALAVAQTNSLDPEFQQRASELLEEARKWRTMGEEALKTLATKINDGRQLGKTALNELEEVTKRMQALLDQHPGAPKAKEPAPAAAEH
jgi:hypothetical protein